MKDYFMLQFTRLKRRVFSPPVFVNNTIHFITIMVLFIGLSGLLFYITEYAVYIFLAISLSLTAQLSEVRRNEFLWLCFGDRQHRKVRIIENLVVCSPFVVLLLAVGEFYLVVLLVVITCVMALVRYKATFNPTLPTPFFRRPFEFAMGFRYSFPVFLLIYVLVAIAILVCNFNLGLFCIVAIFVSVLFFYARPEDEYFVWVHSGSAARFLVMKILTGFEYTFYLCLPVVFALGYFYPANVAVPLVFVVIGYFYLAMMICAKYACFPDEIDLARGMMMFLCFIVPPLVLVAIPLFYRQAVNKLVWYLV